MATRTRVKGKKRTRESKHLAGGRKAKRSGADAENPIAGEGQAEVLGSEMVYEGKVFGVRRDEVVEPGGVRVRREVIAHAGSVVVLPVLPNGKIVLIRQYRYATRKFLWELVAGRMDGDETPEEGAARELREETGYRAKKIKEFLSFWPTPGFLEEKMHLLLAEGLREGEAEPEEDEKIIKRAFDAKELKQMIRENEIVDGKTIAGVLYYFTFLR